MSAAYEPEHYLAEARAEIQRLRDALEPFADSYSWHNNYDGTGIIFQPSGDYSEEKCQRHIDRARAALSGTPSEDTE